jgi:hypothetical protein
MDDHISLSQKIYLLGINPKNGGILADAYTAMNYTLLGMLFLEMYLNKNIEFVDKRIVIKNSKSDVPIHHFLLEKLKKSKRDLRISNWMNKLYFSQKFIRGDVQQALVYKRIIKMRQKRFLFFRWSIPVIINKQAVYHLLSDVENSIFRGTDNEEEIMLLSFLKPAGLLRRIFPEKEKRKQALLRLKKMRIENQVSVSVADAISAAQAVAASVAVSSAAASAATSS